MWARAYSSAMAESTSALVVFDLDGTLLRGDSVCEAIARHIGTLPRMRELEVLPWSSVFAAREEMASWYAPYSREHLLEGLQHVRLAPGAEEGVRLLRERGVTVAICSLTWEVGVEWVAGALGVSHFVGTGLEPSGRIVHFLPEDKPRWTTELRSRLGIPAEKVAAVGDSSGDIPLLIAAKHAYFVGREPPEALRDHAIHMPDGNIRDIAVRILATFG